MKANFGHMEGASGIAAFIKTVMVLESGIIPPIAQLETLNPRIPAKFWNVEVGGDSPITTLMLTQARCSSFERRKLYQEML